MCESPATTGTLTQHNAENTAKHLQKVCDWHAKLQDEVRGITQLVAQLSRNFDKLSHALFEHRKSNEAISQASHTAETSVQCCKDSLHKVESQVGSLRQDTMDCRASIAALQTNEMVDRRVCSELNQQMQQIISLVTQTSITVADVDSRVCGLEDTSYNGVFVWEFGVFESRLNSALADGQKSFVSPIFYTSRHGYSLCMRFYPAGDGIGRGTHVSLFMAVVRGKYD